MESQRQKKEVVHCAKRILIKIIADFSPETTGTSMAFTVLYKCT